MTTRLPDDGPGHGHDGGPDDGPDTTSPVTRAVVGVVVGIAIFAFVGVVGYFAVVTVGMRSWADQRGASAERSVASAPASTSAGAGTGRETTLDASNEAYRQ
ncbi:MAG: hypothetical protein ACI38P_15855, partial [Cellulosimicrobium funkei]